MWQEDLQRTNLELDSYKEKIKENQEKIKLNKQLPYLVGNIVEVIMLCYLSACACVNQIFSTLNANFTSLPITLQPFENDN